MNIGDKVRFKPSAWYGRHVFANGMTIPDEVTGKVIYVSPKGRFVVAEAAIHGAVIRESIWLDHRQQEERP